MFGSTQCRDYIICIVSVTYYRNSGSVFREGRVLEGMTLLVEKRENHTVGHGVCVCVCVVRNVRKLSGIGTNGRRRLKVEEKTKGKSFVMIKKGKVPWQPTSPLTWKWSTSYSSHLGPHSQAEKLSCTTVLTSIWLSKWQINVLRRQFIIQIIDD